MPAPSSFRSHAAGLFLLSVATLLLELSLTRVLSVTLWYHFGFLVISTALLGFGVSGVMLAIWRSLANTPRLDFALSLFALGFSIAVVASFWCMQRIPFDPFALATDHRQLLFMPLYLIVVAVPFFFAGGAISLLLTRSGSSVTLSNHVVLDTDPPAPGGRKSFTGGFLLKKSAFTAADLEIIRAPYNEHGRENIAAGNPWGASHRVVLYAPDHIQPGSLYQQIVDAPDLETVIGSTEMQLAPATDNKPFFNQHTRWTSIRWSTIRDMFSQDKPLAARLALEDRPVAEVTLLVLFVQTAVIAALFILLPLLLSRNTGLQWSASWHWLVYFAALGLAFIMVEIASLQHFLLFLGQPIYTYAVVLASLLIFTGLGSFFSERWPASVAVLRSILPFIVVVVAVWSLLTPAVFHIALGLPLVARILIAVALVAPLGFALGMPFPLGLRIAVQESAALGAWAWGVNGFFTVLGTVLALMLGMMAGFVAVLILACLCYGCAFFAVLSFVPATEPKLEGAPELAT